MATPESKATSEVLVMASSLGCRLMRNNTGAFVDERGIPVRFGLGNESKKLNEQMKFGDQIGVTPVVITPEMVGKTIGVFTMMEVKPDGHLEKTLRKANKHHKSREAAQLRGIEFIQSLGGMAWFVTNQSEMQQIHEAFIEGLKS